MAGKGGGAWKVAYADFVTAMMAFFMVMWLTSQNKAVKESVSQYFENPLGTAAEARATSVHGIPGASSQNAELEGQQAGPLGSNKHEIGTNEITGEGGVGGLKPSRPQLHIFERLDRTRAVGTMVVFGLNSVELSKQAHLQLSGLIPDLLGKPNKVEVRGHAVRGALTPGGPYKDLWELSFARSIATMNYLIAHGIEPDRIRLSQDAAYEPYSHDGNEAEDPRNARVEVFAIDELAHVFKTTIDQRAGNFVSSPDQPDPPPAAAEEHAVEDGHGGAHGSGDKGHGKTESTGHGKGSATSHGAKPAPAKSDGHGAKAASKDPPKKSSGHH
ncbi:MAG: flagellar motor protein MotB [Planctomycetaceae bacterium]|nr:flagellar motor protein MotB [Planctomycetaceae bacterium]